MSLESLVGGLLPDEGWTCKHCGNHNDDIYNDVCEGCEVER